MRGQRLRLAILAADTAAIPLALVVAYLLRYGRNVHQGVSTPVVWGPLPIAAVAAVSWLLFYGPMELDCFQSGWQLPATVSRISLAVSLQAAIVLAFAYLLRAYYSRLVLAYFAGLFFALVLLVRLMAYGMLCLRHHAGRTRKLVIIGEGSIGRELASRIGRHPELLCETLGFLNPVTGSGGPASERPNGLATLGSLDALELLRTNCVQEVIVLLEHPPGLEFQSFLERCRAQGICVSLLPQPYQLYSSRARLLEIDGVPLISLEAPANHEFVGALKRAMDLVLGTLLLLPAFPITLVAGTGLWSQGRRFLRRELRCGQDGEPFWMYRLDVDRHAPNAPAFDRFLWRMSISELPQLLNVLAGQMSLVGPRPESPERVHDYSEWQRQRLKIKPGMTGLAQVNGLREQHSSEEKTRYDLQYMLNWAPAVDLVLLLQTLWTLAARLGRKGEIPVAPRPHARAQESSSAAASSFPD